VIGGTDGVGSVLRKSLGAAARHLAVRRVLGWNDSKPRTIMSATSLHFRSLRPQLQRLEWDSPRASTGKSLIFAASTFAHCGRDGTGEVDCRVPARRLANVGSRPRQVQRRSAIGGGFARTSDGAARVLWSVRLRASIRSRRGHRAGDCFTVRPSRLTCRQLDADALHFRDWKSSLLPHQAWAWTCICANRLCRVFFGPARPFYEVGSCRIQSYGAGRSLLRRPNPSISASYEIEREHRCLRADQGLRTKNRSATCHSLLGEPPTLAAASRAPAQACFGPPSPRFDPKAPREAPLRRA